MRQFHHSINQKSQSELEIIDYPYTIENTQPNFPMQILLDQSFQKIVPSTNTKSRINNTQILKCNNLDNTLNDEFSEETPSMKNTFRTESNGLPTKRQNNDSMINNSFTQQETETIIKQQIKGKLEPKKINRIKVNYIMKARNTNYRANKKLQNHHKTISLEEKDNQPYCIYCEETYKEICNNNYPLPDKQCIYCLKKINKQSLEQYRINNKLLFSFHRISSISMTINIKNNDWKRKHIK